jgi:hypothetical protein
MPSRSVASITSAVVSVIVLIAGPAIAQRGTDAQREACTPDAFRLCSSAMPDASRVESCLRAAGPRLSSACYQVFYPQQADRSDPRRRYDRRDDDSRNLRRDDYREDGYERRPSRGYQSRPQDDDED